MRELTDHQKAFLALFAHLQKVKAEGFAGVLPTGEIVDRREHPKAIPMQKNSLLNIPEPQPLPADH